MEKVVPVVLVRRTGELNTEYAIDRIVCVDRHFEISTPYCPKQSFVNLKAVCEYVFNLLPNCEIYTMAHYSIDIINYDILIIDISNNEHTYIEQAEFCS